MNTTLTVAGLRARLRMAHPGALLVGPRIVRRVIRLDRRLSRLRAAGLRRAAYVIDRSRLLAYAEDDELGIDSPEDLPPRVILLAEPSEENCWSGEDATDVLLQIGRLLLHASAYLEVDQRIRRELDASSFLAARRAQIGRVEFAEFHDVLARDGLLFADATETDVYREFVATYVELKHFEPQDLPVFFPAIRDWEKLGQLVDGDVDSASLIANLEPLRPDPDWKVPVNQAPPRGGSWPLNLIWAFGSTGRRMNRARARRASVRGNYALAAILQTRAAGPDDVAANTLRAAETELRRLTDRLQRVLGWSTEDAEQGFHTLRRLLRPAANGFWTQEARLLYDLQKLCVEHERDIFQVDLWALLRYRGARPVRHPLPLLREVLIAKHLRSATRRLPLTQLPAASLEGLSSLLRHSQQSLEQHTRQSTGPTIQRTLDEVGLIPGNRAERCAREKIVHELLDHIVEHGVANMGNLRDALSRSDLKLPDLSGVDELTQGDQLLRADRRLGRTLRGVYRPGAIYLRWAHRISSLAFGTPLGRALTRYLVLPFGGALLIVEGCKHLASMLSGHVVPSTEETEAAMLVAESQRSSPVVYYLVVGLVGLWLGAMIHAPEFRQAFLRRLDDLRALLCRALIDLPRAILRWPPLRNLLNSPAFRFLRGYVMGPALLTALISCGFWLADRKLRTHTVVEVFLLAALVVNSTIGRFVEEWTSDVILRAWEDLRIRVFAALARWIMNVFQQLIANLERVLYAVDAWFRFRTGERRLTQAVKLVAATCWYFASYLVVFVFTLLVEPQINPIKHFPVVTVSHKLILPAGPAIVEQLQPYIGKPRANTLVWTTIWLIPGVFGFLVWELKENWRLYAANRPRLLVPVPFGHHGETMTRMLRPGIHSGTLPKLFTRLRSLTIAARHSGRRMTFEKRRAKLESITRAVRRFVERDFLAHLAIAEFRPALEVPAHGVRLATNRIEVACYTEDRAEPVIVVAWDDADRVVAAAVQINHPAWESDSDRDRLLLALRGALQMSDVVQCESDQLSIPLLPPLTWEEWSRLWS